MLQVDCELINVSLIAPFEASKNTTSETWFDVLSFDPLLLLHCMQNVLFFEPLCTVRSPVHPSLWSLCFSSIISLLIITLLFQFFLLWLLALGCLPVSPSYPLHFHSPLSSILWFSLLFIRSYTVLWCVPPVHPSFIFDVLVCSNNIIELTVCFQLAGGAIIFCFAGFKNGHCNLSHQTASRLSLR